jgi:catechol 2,3-dioxygenase-like lactoylglutathione lyase family enzyme
METVCDAVLVARAASSDGPIPVTGVSEIVLEVLDLERALRFYSDVLGLAVISRRDDGERAWLMAGTGTRIGLWRPQVGIAGGRGGVHVHFALHLGEDAYDDAVARLRSLGYEPEEHCFDDQGRAAYVDDPDGNVVEFWTWDVAGHLTQ